MGFALAPNKALTRSIFRINNTQAYYVIDLRFEEAQFGIRNTLTRITNYFF